MVLPFPTALIALVCLCGKSLAAKFEVAIVPKLVNSPFFDVVGEGCAEVAKLVSQQSQDEVECHYRGSTVADASAQAQVIDDLVSQKISGLAIAVLDANITGAAIDRAVAAGIPVITFDADAPDSKRLTFIGTDDLEIGHSCAWLLSLRSQVGKYAVISSNAENVQRRVDGLGFKLQQSFPETGWSQHGDTTDCQDDTAVAMEQVRALAKEPIDAIVSIGGWPMWHENGILWREFVRENPDLLLIAVDSLPIQRELLSEGYVDALVGQRPQEMGKRAMDLLYSFLSDPGFQHPTQIFTGEEIFIKSTSPTTVTKDASLSSGATALVFTWFASLFSFGGVLFVAFAI